MLDSLAGQAAVRVALRAPSAVGPAQQIKATPEDNREARVRRLLALPVAVVLVALVSKVVARAREVEVLAWHLPLLAAVSLAAVAVAAALDPLRPPELADQVEEAREPWSRLPLPRAQPTRAAAAVVPVARAATAARASSLFVIRSRRPCGLLRTT